MIAAYQKPPEPEVGKPVPEVAFYRSDGKAVRLAQLRGKILIVEFTSLNCPPCRAMAPKLEKFAEEYGKKDVVCLVVSTDPPDCLPKLAALREVGDPTLLLQDAYNSDRSKMAVWQFGNVAVPTMFVVDRNGKFASRQIYEDISHLKYRVEWALSKAKR